MLPNLTHYPVNWVNGMKITQQQFIEFEHFVSDHLRDATALGLTSYNYGLLPAEFAPQIIPDPNNNLRVQIKNCRAITKAGCRIELVDQSIELATSYEAILKEFSMMPADELEFYIVLGVDLFNRQPIGIPSAMEQFPREPFSIPTYLLSVVPLHKYGGPASHRSANFSSEFESFHLVVGHLIYKNGQLENKKEYIPACTSINSHDKLRGWADETWKLMAELQDDALKIVNKVCDNRNREEVRKVSVLAELVHDLSEQLAASLDDVLNQFKFTAYEQAPIYLIEKITLATRKLNTTLNTLNSNSATVSVANENVLRYFQDWTDISPVQLKDGMNKVINFSYNHTNLYPHLQTITQCWTAIARIFNELTKLQYIGQTKQGKLVHIDSVSAGEQKSVMDQLFDATSLTSPGRERLTPPKR